MNKKTILIERSSRVLREKIPMIYKIAVKIYNWVGLAKQDGERYISNGEEYPDRTFFVIRCSDNNLGLMAYFNSTIGWIEYAVEKGWIPIVDMQNYRNPYLNIEKFGKENSWEYYFIQPMNFGLESISSAKNIVLSDTKTYHTAIPMRLGQSLVASPRMYNSIYTKYISFNDKVDKLLKSALDMFAGKKVLGVLNRGTDLVGAKGHSVQPTVDEMLEIVEKCSEEWGEYEAIFLATEENSVIKKFESYFGADRILYNEAKRFDEFNGNLLSKVSFDRENDEYLKGLEYLTTVFLLSNCDSLISTYVGGSVAALVMNCGRYNHIKMIDLGVY